MDAVVSCVCGNTFNTISTVKSISVEICSKCHPFFTGQQKFVDTEGRIEKFGRKLKLSDAKKSLAKEKTKKSSKDMAKSTSLKDLLKQAKETK